MQQVISASYSIGQQLRSSLPCGALRSPSAQAQVLPDTGPYPPLVQLVGHVGIVATPLQLQQMVREHREAVQRKQVSCLCGQRLGFMISWSEYCSRHLFSKFQMSISTIYNHGLVAVLAAKSITHQSITHRLLASAQLLSALEARCSDMAQLQRTTAEQRRLAAAAARAGEKQVASIYASASERQAALDNEARGQRLRSWTAMTAAAVDELGIIKSALDEQVR